MIANEIGNHFAFTRRLYIGLDTAQGVEHRCVALVNVAVGLGNVVDGLVAETLVAHYVGINTIVADGVVSHDDEWRHIAVDAATALHHCPFAYFAARVQHHRRAKYDIGVDFALVGNVAAVAKNDVVVDFGIVHDVRLGHDEHVTADAGGTAVVDTTVDD